MGHVDSVNWLFAADRFVASLNILPATAAQYGATLRAFVGTLPASGEASQEPGVSAYIRELQRRNVSPRTAASRLRQTRRFLEWLDGEEGLSEGWADDWLVLQLHIGRFDATQRQLGAIAYRTPGLAEVAEQVIEPGRWSPEWVIDVEPGAFSRSELIRVGQLIDSPFRVTGMPTRWANRLRSALRSPETALGLVRVRSVWPIDEMRLLAADEEPEMFQETVAAGTGERPLVDAPVDWPEPDGYLLPRQTEEVETDKETEADVAVPSQPITRAEPSVSAPAVNDLAANPGWPQTDGRRYLEGAAPPAVASGKTLEVAVRVVRRSGEGPRVPIDLGPIPDGGVELELLVDAPGFDPPNPERVAVRVMPDRDTQWERITLRAVGEGLQRIYISAYLGGTILGTLRLEVEVGADIGAEMAPGDPVAAALTSRPADPDELSLIVSWRPGAGGGRFTYQLQGAAARSGMVSRQSLRGRLRSPPFREPQRLRRR